MTSEPENMNPQSRCPDSCPPLKSDHIDKKIKLYKKILKSSLNECKKKKEGLDLYYQYLHRANSSFQSSVIVLSAASTFIQSLTANEFGGDQTIRIIILSITSYSGLILAIAKYMRLDEMKESAQSLRDRFAELQSRIRYYIDLIKPWKNEAHYENHPSEKTKKNQWVSLIDQIEKEYINIIDTKKELSASYEKIIDSVITRKYEKIYEKLYPGEKREVDTESDEEDNTSDDVSVSSSNGTIGCIGRTPREPDSRRRADFNV